MIIHLTILSALAIISHGASRYIIHNYTVLGSGKRSAFPLDICLNYEVGVDMATLSPFSLFGIFSCNSANDAVSFQSYGQDSTCTTADGATLTVSDDQAAVGTLGEFNCVGEDNYAVTQGCTTSKAATEPQLNDDGGEDVCCQDFTGELYGCSPTIFAMNVCVFQESDAGSIYVNTLCDSYGTTRDMHLSTDTTCATAISEIDATDVDSCGFVAREFVVDAYARVTSCVLAGDEQVTPNMTHPYCPITTTASPTKAPTTMPTTSPVMISTLLAEDSKASMKSIGFVMIGIVSAALYMAQ